MKKRTLLSVVGMLAMVSLACEDTVAPEPDDDVLPFVELSAADFHTCARRSDGAVHCWGSNEGGALGIPLDDAPAVPVPVALPDAADSIAAGGGASCAILDGAAWCWGSLPGTGTTPTPMLTAPGIAWVELIPSNRHDRTYLCGIAADGAAFCWGAQGSHLGTDSVAADEPVVLAHGGWTSIAARSTTTCGVRGDSAGYCWGTAPEFPESAVPQAVWPELSWETLQPGPGFICGIAGEGGVDAGRVRCWGQMGEFLIGTTPVTMPHRADKLAVGAAHACAIDDGWLRCWGSNGHGQLGLGDRVSRGDPILVDPTTRWVDVAAGVAHTCAIASDGSVWCWGSNARNQTGTEWPGARLRPGLVSFEN